MAGDVKPARDNVAAHTSLRQLTHADLVVYPTCNQTTLLCITTLQQREECDIGLCCEGENGDVPFIKPDCEREPLVLKYVEI